MSHYIAEILIPPTNDVKDSIAQIMDYFRDDEYDDDDNVIGKAEHAHWWDWWIIGGRFSGHKIECSLDAKRLDEFHDELKARKVTVSALQCGKQQLQPADQAPMVDELWRKFFPGKGDKCLLFSHAWSQYGKDGIHPGDVCRWCEVPAELTCTRLIVAGPHWRDESKLQPDHMLVTEFWNLVDWQKTDFDGKVVSALNAMRTRDIRPATFDDDWLMVTVDYHN